MRLSEKGFEKIEVDFGGYCWGWENYEFEPDDFQDAVILTVEEAKEILQSSYDVLSWTICGPTHRDNALNVQRLLKHRIEQAKMSKQST